jgi:Mg/Co/Ni transporter MgtE
MLSTFNRNGRRVNLSDRTVCNVILIAAGVGLTVGFALVMFALDALARWAASNALGTIAVAALAIATVRLIGTKR